MSLFSIFKSRKTKHIESLHALLKIASNINQFVERRLTLVNKGVLVDLEFETNMFESNLVFSYNKYNCLDVFDDDYKKLMLKVFSEQELVFDDLDELNGFLEGFIIGVKRNIAEISKSPTKI